MSGRVVHFEVPFDDGDRARSFYKEAFGWQLQEMPEMGYTMVMSGPSGDSGPTEAGFINGGMLSREQAATRGPVIVVDVDSIDASRWRRSAGSAAPPSSGRRRSATWASPPTSRTPRATSSASGRPPASADSLTVRGPPSRSTPREDPGR